MALERQQCATEQRLRLQAQRRHCARRLGALALLTAFLTATPYASAPASLDDLLTEPPSPAADALLAPHAADPRVERRWRAGLHHPDALMRGTAARLLALDAATGSLADLRVALAAEVDVHARGEMARALIVLGSPDDDQIALTALRRVDPMARRRALATLAALRPASLVADVRRSAGRSVVATELGAVLDALIDAGAPEADALMTLVALRPDTAALAQLLAAAARWQRPVPPEALETALHDAALLPPALVYLASRGNGATSSVADVATQQAATAGPPAALTAEDRVLFALRDRWLGTPAADVRDAIAGLRDGSAVYTLPDAVLTVLTREERRALEQRFDMTGPGRTLLGRVAFQRLPRGAHAARRHPVRLLSDLPAGLPAALRAATDCRPTNGDDRVASIRYRPDGRPFDVVLDTDGLSAGCARFAETLARLAWGPAGLASDQPARMVVRLEAADCDGAARRPVIVAASARELAADLARPRRISHRAPVYPREARGRRIEGTVLIDTRIDDVGCVASAQVVGSLDPALDVQAVRAVAGWRYEPATLDGTPVPVQMDVAVRFVLK